MSLAAKFLRMAYVDGKSRTIRKRDTRMEFPSFFEDAPGETEGWQPV